MRVGIGNDHPAIELKNIIKEHLESKGFEVVDYGTSEPGVKVDYPIYGQKVAEAVAAGEVEKGILICGTGVGISIAANKVPGIRAGLCTNTTTARLIVEHNNANIVAFGCRIVGSELAKDIVDTFFSAQYEGGRHQKRLDIITDIEKKYSK